MFLSSMKDVFVVFESFEWFCVQWNGLQFNPQIIKDGPWGAQATIGSGNGLHSDRTQSKLHEWLDGKGQCIKAEQTHYLSMELARHTELNLRLHQRGFAIGS